VRTLRLAAFVILALCAPPAVCVASDVVASSRTASIVHDSARQLWTIANDVVQLDVQADPGIDLRLIQLRIPQTGDRFPIPDDSGATLTVDGQPGRIGRAADGYSIASVRGEALPLGVDLIVQTVFRRTLVVTRHYALYDDSPTFEMWTTVESKRSAPYTLADLNAFALTVPAGIVRWVNGLRGDASDVVRDDAFSLQARLLSDGDEVALGSTMRSSEDVVPWIAVEGKQTFFGGVMWSGAWSITASRRGDAIALRAGLGSTTTTLAAGESKSGPHGFLGIVPGPATEATKAMTTFIVNGVRGGRQLAPLVTYNMWFAYGTRIDEDVVRREMEGAAAVGTELFVLDAGWYADAGELGTFDFESGLGRWIADERRFPSGLRALTEYAHQLGMKFGLWMEPERVFLDLVGRAGEVAEPWLATAGGSYESPRTAQICLASDKARQWVFAQVTSVIDAVQPDYLKWDNNFWINCDRSGHGHGAEDGNFAHVTGLYDLLSDLRARYPGLLIENVSGGGNRLDVGMLRYTDVGWMDDRTVPSVRVRHNAQGLSTVFPLAYLLSFAMEHESEPLHNGPDLLLSLRSRMMGVLGTCIRHAEFSEGETADIARQVAIYKSLRDVIATSSATLLTPQAASDDAPWDALQARGAHGGAVIVAVQNDPGVDRITVRPRDLGPAITYEVRSVDQGVLGSAKGDVLMADGIEILASPISAAHVLTLAPAAAPGDFRP